LYLSPNHSLFIGGLLIPVEWQVNGRSIALAKMDDREVIEHFHIEFETHEVVLAEGAPAETLLVTNDRENFSNFVEYERLYGVDKRPAMKPFASILNYRGRSWRAGTTAPIGCVARDGHPRPHPKGPRTSCGESRARRCRDP
jgi:Hint domain